MRIFHIATAADWAAAKRAGSYEISTLGRTLAEEGFIHASRREQVAGTFTAFYADAQQPLVLLAIETDRLTSPLRRRSPSTSSAGIQLRPFQGVPSSSTRGPSAVIFAATAP